MSTVSRLTLSSSNGRFCFIYILSYFLLYVVRWNCRCRIGHLISGRLQNRMQLLNLQQEFFEKLICLEIVQGCGILNSKHKLSRLLCLVAAAWQSHFQLIHNYNPEKSIHGHPQFIITLHSIYSFISSLCRATHLLSKYPQFL